VNIDTTFKVRATSTFDDTKYGYAEIILAPEIPVSSVVVEPANIDVNRGGTSYFSATVYDDEGWSHPNQDVTWKIVEEDIAAGTDIDTSFGLLRVSANEELNKTLTIRATSMADPSVYGDTIVTVRPPTINGIQMFVNFEPAEFAMVFPGGEFLLTYDLSATGEINPEDIEVKWEIDELLADGTKINEVVEFWGVTNFYLLVATEETAKELTLKITIKYNGKEFSEEATIAIGEPSTINGVEIWVDGMLVEESIRASPSDTFELLPVFLPNNLNEDEVEVQWDIYNSEDEETRVRMDVFSPAPGWDEITYTLIISEGETAGELTLIVAATYHGTTVYNEITVFVVKE
jgi:hypothetical protein